MLRYKGGHELCHLCLVCSITHPHPCVLLSSLCVETHHTPLLHLTDAWLNISHFTYSWLIIFSCLYILSFDALVWSNTSTVGFQLCSTLPLESWLGRVPLSWEPIVHYLPELHVLFETFPSSRGIWMAWGDNTLDVQPPLPLSWQIVFWICDESWTNVLGVCVWLWLAR